MQHAIWAKIDEREPITSLKLESVQNTAVPIMNELIGLLTVQENFSNEGLHQLVFSGGDKHMGEPLDLSVMGSLLGKC